jgi:redox-sensitive bicupin YhaK (pirin superfamily)
MEAQVEIVISGRQRDLGGFSVRRVLPWSKRRMVGPFIFFDEMGPEILGPGRGIDVRPHPHIGLSTVTYLFAGELLHRDSLGTVQAIRPGAVNWMTAGRGIAHSERTAPAERAREKQLFGIQTWIAHPREQEEIEPSFHHHAVDALPVIEDRGVWLRLILGELEGRRSPVTTFSPTLYAEVTLDAGSRFSLPVDCAERGVYVVEGTVELPNGELYSRGALVVFGPGSMTLRAPGPGPTKFMLIGGERLDGERFIEWNFVSSSKERIEAAKADWKARRFAEIPGETEFIPLPSSGPAEVTYP